MTIPVETFRLRIGCFIQPGRKKFKIDNHQSQMSHFKPLGKRTSRKLLFSILILSLLVAPSIFSNNHSNRHYYPMVINSSSLSSRFIKPGLSTFISIGHILKNNPNFHARYTNGNKRQHGIRIAHFNKGPAHLHNRVQEIEGIIQDHHPHLLGLSEANFFHTHDLNDARIQDYDIFTSLTLTNPDIQASRIIVYKHRSLVGKLRTDLMDNKFSSIWLEIGFPNQKKFLVCQFYRDWQYVGQSNQASKSQAAQFERWNLFIDQWERALATGLECHLLGDCNIDAQVYSRPDIAEKAHNKKLKPMVEKLFESIFPHGFSQLVTSPTRQDSILDHYYSNRPCKISPVIAENRGGSDHKLIIATRYAKPIKRQQRYVTKRSYKNFKADEFKAAVKNILWFDLYQCEDVEQAVAIFTRKITTILDSMAPVRKIQARSRFAPWLSEETKKIMRARDYAQQRALESKKIGDIKEFKNLRNQVTNRLKKEKRNWKQNKLLECGDDSGKLWRNVLGWLDWKSSGAPTQIFYKGALENKPARIAASMNEYFINKVEHIVENLPESDNDPLKPLLVRQFNLDPFHLKPVYPDNVKKIIAGLRNSKTAGIDYLDTTVIKMISEDIVPAITHIVNLSIRYSKFPECWKYAKIIPLHKKEDILNPKNYRPVAILPILSKILERAIFEQVVEYFEGNHLFYPNHHGFRKHHNTCTALLQMYDGWVEAADRGDLTGVCLLDMSAAFDTVNHSLLLQKLRLYGFSQDSLAWMSSYLSGRKQSVCIDGTMSPPLWISTGVPQGSILGPLFYIIFPNDLPETIYTCHKHSQSHSSTVGSSSPVFTTHCQDCGSVCCFADDSTLSLSDSDPALLTEKLKEKYAVLSDYLSSNKLKLNDEKTHLVLMTTAENRRLKNPIIELAANAQIVATTEAEKLLGTFIHQDLKWNEYLAENENSLLKSLTTRVNALKKVSFYSSFRTRLMIGNGLFMSKLIYLIPVWGGASSGLLKMLQVAQNNAARYITRSSWYTPKTELMEKCNWLSVKQLAAYHSLVLIHKTLVSQQPRYLYEKFSSPYPCNTRLSATNSIRIDGSFNADLSVALSSFRWRASGLYNTLPAWLRAEPKLSKFKAGLRSWVKGGIDI